MYQNDIILMKATKLKIVEIAQLSFRLHYSINESRRDYDIIIDYNNSGI